MKERALSPAFVLFMHDHDGMPQEKCVRAWADTHRPHFMQNGQYSNVRNGEWVDSKYINILVSYLLDTSEPDNAREREVLFAYLRENGEPDPGRLSLSAVIDVVSVEPELGDDGFAAGMKVFLSIMRLYSPWESVRPIRTEERVREAAAWTCIECGRQMRNKPSLPHAQALIEAQKRMGISVSAYQDWWVAMYRRNPGCVMDIIGTDGRKTILKAMSGMLPVTEQFYHRVRKGECFGFQATPEDVLTGNSRFIVLEAYGPDPDLDRVSPGLGADLVMGMICHQASLSDVPRLGTRGVPLRIISFAGTPQSGRRLESFEYKAVGTCLPGTRIKVLERFLSYRESTKADTLWMGIFRALQHRLRDPDDDQPRPEPRPESDRPETA